ncbi:hypothetical protein HMPREF9010_04704 [Bacteroides sp. 3_1_23]|nr:hypothetical protein HMPREF9010_04704 [Bacteroides sp. 3_1_23]
MYVRETSSDKGINFLSYVCSIYTNRFRIAIGLWFVQQPYPRSYALYEVSVRQTRYLPPASFRFQLARDTIAIGCMIPAIRAHWGLASGS